jgi:hypothetical protein
MMVAKKFELVSSTVTNLFSWLTSEFLSSLHLAHQTLLHLNASA